MQIYNHIPSPQIPDRAGPVSVTDVKAKDNKNIEDRVNFDQSTAMASDSMSMDRMAADKKAMPKQSQDYAVDNPLGTNSISELIGELIKEVMKRILMAIFEALGFGKQKGDSYGDAGSLPASGVPAHVGGPAGAGAPPMMGLPPHYNGPAAASPAVGGAVPAASVKGDGIPKGVSSGAQGANPNVWQPTADGGLKNVSGTNSFGKPAAGSEFSTTLSGFQPGEKVKLNLLGKKDDSGKHRWDMANDSFISINGSKPIKGVNIGKAGDIAPLKLETGHHQFKAPVGIADANGQIHIKVSGRSADHTIYPDRFSGESVR